MSAMVSAKGLQSIRRFGRLQRFSSSVKSARNLGEGEYTAFSCQAPLWWGEFHCKKTNVGHFVGKKAN